MYDQEFRITYVNPEAERMFGFSRDELIGKHPKEVLVPPAAHQRLDELFERVRKGEMTAHGTAENLRKDGSAITCDWYNTPLHKSDGSFVGIMSMAQDITDRQRLEEQLRQAQKMEAIGQLAGGVANDFNNLLTVISSYGESHLQNLAPQDPRRRSVEQMLSAAKRAATLTQQLLAFSRRQVMQPKIIDLNEVLSNLDGTARRTAGPSIDLKLNLAPDLGKVRVDRAQIEQVLMNLVSNARDAMPSGGTLTIETANVELDEIYTRLHPTVKPGSCVMLSVTDTGIGMDAETQARVFEPFFTTKEQGKGAGLGLATVYGIVKQSGGNVWFTSAPNQGAIFKIYFPRIKDALDEVRPDTTVKSDNAANGETILLVEDEVDVRVLIAEMLESEGYRVLQAGNGKEGLDECEKHLREINLVMTDVVMPQMNGPEMAERITKIAPECKMLYMSGYMDKVIVNQGVQDRNFMFLEKPFTAALMLRKVREALDKPRAM
jgi:two-component system, cell cycle sensor histidine kinase and response regulator CckA